MKTALLLTAALVLATALGLGVARGLVAIRGALSAGSSQAAAGPNATVLYLSFDPTKPTQTALVATDVASGASITLTTLSHPAGWGPEAFLSPNGTAVAVLGSTVTDVNGPLSLAVVPTGGGVPIVIADSTLLRPASPPAWSTDEATIYYIRRPSTAYEVVAAPVRGGPGQIVYSSTRVIDFIGNTPAGLVIATADGAHGRSLTLLPRSGAPTQLNIALPSTFGAPAQFGGSVMAYYLIQPSGASLGLADITTLATESPLALTGNAFSLAHDASKVVFDDRGAFRQGTTHVNVWTRSSGSTSSLGTAPGRFAHPVESRSWSADGKSIALESDEFGANGTLKARGIEVLAVDGSSAKLLLPPVSGSLRLVGVK